MMCDACPVRDLHRIRDCPGIGHAPICDDIRRGREGRADQVIWVATGKEPPRTSAETARLMAAVDAEFCRHASGPCGCGDGPPRLCGHADRPLEVRRADCIACVVRAAWESGVDPAP